MAEYKRFVSYIYNYEKKEKKNNIGYARIENRGTKCKITIHVQIKSVSAGAIKVYGFVRKEKDLQGIFLGDISLRNGSGDCQINTQVNKVADTKYQFSDLGGIILYINDDKFFGSQWDDIPIEYERFQIGTEDDILLKTAELKEEDEDIEEEAVEEEGSVTTDVSAMEDVSVTTETGELLEEIEEKEIEPEDNKEDALNFGMITIREIHDRYGYHVKNDFMLHGYRRFGHLGVMEQNEGKIIGVPGVFCRREQEVARNYGFENFLPRVPKKLEYGDFGYWYANMEYLK